MYPGGLNGMVDPIYQFTCSDFGAATMKERMIILERVTKNLQLNE